LDAASRAVRAYIKEHDIPSSRFTGGDVAEGGQIVARISYNGRIWAGEAGLFPAAALPVDQRPEVERTAAGRYLEPDLFSAVAAPEPPRMRARTFLQVAAGRSTAEVLALARGFEQYPNQLAPEGSSLIVVFPGGSSVIVSDLASGMPRVGIRTE
jgi:hypothetical protein